MNRQQENAIMEIFYELFPSTNPNLKVEITGPQLKACSNPTESAQDRDKYEQAMLYNSVTKPSHYNQHGIEAIQAIEASMSSEEFRGYLKGNTMKYLWRYSYKGKAIEDLEKAQVYLGWLIERVKDGNK